MKQTHKILIIFIISTFFLLIQHFLFLGWDFSVYVSNAKHFFEGSSFFEISRPPLTSFILGLFSFLGWKLSEYFYIFLISLLFLYSSVRLAKSLNLNSFHFYLFSANFFVLSYGLIEGSELLAFALLELFFAFLIEDNPFSTIFLSLACLTRYPFVIFFPLLLFHKRLKNKLLSAFLFVLPFIPWFIYNKFYYGNIFYSLADSYALNIFYRDYIPHTINFSSILLVSNILLPLFFLGLFSFFYSRDFSRKNLIFLISSALIIYSIFSMKADIIRYYFPLVLPIVFFSVYSLSKIPQKISNYILLIFIIFTLIFAISSLFYLQSYEPPQELSSLNCSLQSNVWPLLNYYDIPSEPYPDYRLLNHSIDEGYLIHLDSFAREPDYNSTFISQFPIYSQTEEYIILGNNCTSNINLDYSYLKRLNQNLLLIYNYTVSEDPCVILFDGNSLCYFVNNVFALP